ncbi:MAG: hypothetical protein WEC33_07290 [Dehalococcoidia bacterium]
MTKLLLTGALTIAWVAAGMVALTYYDRGAAPAGACGIGGPYDFDTYEAQDYVSDYGRMIELAARGEVVDFAWTIEAGDHIDLRFQGLERGPRWDRTAASTEWDIPPSIMKSIAWNETVYANAAPPGGVAVPYGGVGAVIRSFDCGYGLGQITTGMSNSTGTATGRQALIATHPLFNLAEGARILADKWNGAPQVRPVAGYGNTLALEDWYYAIWSYNGFAFSNHPLNPNRPEFRGPVYHCYQQAAYDALPGYVNYDRADYTYPELVYGCMRYPPTRLGTIMWQPQVFQMPSPYNQYQAPAFNTEAFLSCQLAGFSGGCPAMDFHTDDPAAGLVTHPDNTPADPLGRTAGDFLQGPSLGVNGPSVAQLAVPAGGTPTSVTVTVQNVGTYIVPFRVRTSSSWIVVRHPSDPTTRTLDAGVAIGTNVQVNVGTTASPILQAGFPSVLTITINPATYPGGTQLGSVWIEPLYGSGSVYKLNLGIHATAAAEHRITIPGALSE